MGPAVEKLDTMLGGALRSTCMEDTNAVGVLLKIEMRVNFS